MSSRETAWYSLLMLTGPNSVLYCGLRAMKAPMPFHSSSRGANPR